MLGLRNPGLLNKHVELGLTYIVKYLWVDTTRTRLWLYPHHISVAYKGFVVPEGIPIPEGTPLTQPLFVGIPSIGASSSQLVPKEEEEEREKEEEENPEGIVTLLDSSDEFEVFNQPSSPENTSANIDFQ